MSTHRIRVCRAGSSTPMRSRPQTRSKRQIRGVSRGKIVVGLLFFGLCAFAEADNEQSKPSLVQDEQSARAYISSSLYEYINRPPYLVIDAETPFFEKRISGKNVWIALVEFYCGESEQNKGHKSGWRRRYLRSPGNVGSIRNALIPCNLIGSGAPSADRR